MTTREAAAGHILERVVHGMDHGGLGPSNQVQEEKNTGPHRKKHARQDWKSVTFWNSERHEPRTLVAPWLVPRLVVW